MLVDSKSEGQSGSTMAQLKERASHHAPRGLGQSDLSWATLLAAGDKLTAIGSSFENTALAGGDSSCKLLTKCSNQDPRWRELGESSYQAQLILVDHNLWDHADFVQESLAQLCNSLRYHGHFLWTGGPTLWPRRAQTRARILRLCSLHGLRLLRHLKINAGNAPGQPAIRGWLLERRDPVHTLVYG